MLTLLDALKKKNFNSEMKDMLKLVKQVLFLNHKHYKF